MSGDAQPRKRKDKRRRKGQVEARRAEEYAEEREILHQLSTSSEPEEEELYPNLRDTDEVIHVYKDAHTGGNIVTKIIFFLLMGGIAVTIGLILLEHRGTTDDDYPAKETPWSLQFEDWSKLATVPDLVPDFLKGGQGDHDHHASHSGEVVDDHGGEHEHGDEEHENDEHSHEEPAQDSGGWFSFSLGGWGGSTDDAEPAEQQEVAESEATTSWFSLNYLSGGQEKIEELVEEVDENEETPASEEVEGSQLSEEQEAEELEEEEEEENASQEEEETASQEEEEEENASQEEQIEEDEENDAREELDEEENLSTEPFEEEALSQERFEEEEEELNLSLPEGEPAQSEEIEENDDLDSGEGEEDDDPRGSVFPRRSSIIEEDEADSLEQDEETETETLREASEEELFPEAIEALQREASELLREQKEAERAAAEAEIEQPEEEEKEEEEESQAEQEDEETEGMALKFGVGVALVVVAHVVLVKKWNSWAEGNEAKAAEQRADIPATQAAPASTTRTPPPTPEPPKLEPPLADWAEEAIKSVELPHVSSSPRTPTPELEEEYGEESEPEEEEEDEEEDLSEDVPPINPKIYEELIAKYGKPTPESSDAEASDDGNREYSDGGEVESVGEEESGGELEGSEPEEEEQKWTNVKKPAQVESESEGEEEEEEEEEESEDEPPPLRKPPQGGGRSTDEPSPIDEEELIRKQLEQADEEFNYERYESALNIYRKVLDSKPQSVRAMYGVARILDKKAEEKKSNVLLQEAIDTYLQLLALENIPEAIFLPAAQRAINRLRFRGLHLKAVSVHKQIIGRFNDTVEYHNDLAINYLMVNRLNDAEQVFFDTLRRWPDDPVALSHYGLVLKLKGQTSESIPLLQRGLAPDHPTTRDARLYFHLGDALLREGRPEEAMEVYKSGVKKSLFRSEYQRSLYNVDHLTARPWWTLKQTTYEEFFKMLEVNWKVIRDEGLSAMKLKGLYQDEAENLRDVGDWKQFQLFARGSRYAENCKKTPVTCKIIGNFAPARGCKRGQSKFSVMEGGTHVWPHCGPTNCRLRAHLGLVVPPGPAIRVAGETRKWAEGKVMVFDDSFEHEVWHNGSALRLVLIIDVWHPDLSPSEKAALSPI